LTNVGNAALTLSSVQVTGSNVGDFSLTNRCGSSLAASAQCTLAVTFAPSATGARTASVVFTDNAAGSPQSLSLIGTGTGPGVSLSATTLTFGSQLVGTSSPAQTVTLMNVGNSALGISSLVVAGANPGDFPETTTCGSSVVAGGSCTISVTFTPTASGSRAATVTITDNAGDSSQTVSLTGTGTNSAVSLTPNSLVFGSQNLGTTSAPQSVTLNNSGNGALNVSGVAMTGANPGDFAETSTCGASVAAGGNCTIAVTFTPSSTGTRSASVTITDDAGNSPQTISLTGTGASAAAVAGLSPSNLTFGSQPITTSSAPQTVTLTNTGSAALKITSLAMAGTNASDFAQTNTCGASVAAGGSCSISVTFTPAAAGSRSATLVVTDNSGNVAGSTQNVGLTGTGTASSVSLSATTLTFGSQAVATTSAAQAVVLTNTGSTSLSITSISVTGTNASDFSQTNTCGSSVAVGGNCTISVTFTPAAAGTRTAAVTIADSAAGSPQTITLTGTGTASSVSLSATTLTFGSQAVATTSAAQAVVLTNTGNASLSITSISVTGTNASDFGQTNTCGSSVAAGGNCTISVTFTPAATGTRTATVDISDNAPGSPQAVSLTGSGLSSQVSLSPSNLTFASQNVGSTSAAQTTTLSNTGNASFNITSISITGANAGDFAETNNCGSSLAQGANCTIQVTFTPTAPLTRTALVNIADSLTGSPQTVSLTGTGSGATVSLSPGTLTFSNQSLGTTSAAQVVTLSNTGNASLSITSISTTGTNHGDFSETNTCGSSVAASGNCTISVTFTPTATGTRTAAVSISDNAAGSPQTITLTGTGTAATASLSVTSLTFSSQNVGTTSTAQSVTLSNTGNATLSIASIALGGTNSADYAQTNTCGSSVAASGNCTISVTFTPTATGTRTAAVSISDNAAGSPQTVSLSGTGTAPAVSLTPTSLSFASQPIDTGSTAQTVTLTNSGNATLTITSLVPTGANASDFTEITDTCGGSLAAGGNCTLEVMFTPSACGPRTATLSITDNASGSPQTVGLSGTGTHDVILTWTASTTPGVTGYNVYRGSTSGGEGPAPLSSSPISGTTYADANVQAGQAYYYMVTAVSSNGTTQSADSSEASAAVPSP